MIATPKVDWLALAPTLSLLGASGVALLGSVLVPWWMRRGFTAFVAFAGFVTAGVFAAIVFDESAEGRTLIAESFTRDRLGALAAIIVAGAGALTVLVSWGENRRDHAGEYYALLAAAGAGMAFFVTAGNLMTLFLGLEWFSIALYILCALDTHRETSLEAGLKYLIVGGFGSAILLFGSALVYGATGELGFSEIAAAGDADNVLLLAGLAMLIAGPRLQGLGGAVPHVDAGRLRGRADVGDGVHGRGDEGGGARPDAADPRRRLPGAGAPLDDRDRGARDASRSRSATSPRSCSGTSSGCSPTRPSRTPASC